MLAKEQFILFDLQPVTGSMRHIACFGRCFCTSLSSNWVVNIISFQFK